MNIIHLDSINSTNDYVKANISSFDDLTAVYTSHQTNGHGRLQRKWLDTGEDNVYMTIALKPFPTLSPIYANFTQYLSVILSLVLEEEFNLKPQIKWPNDVLINNKKIAGILAEGTSQGGKFLGLALGIGINLNTTPEIIAKIDKPATSLFIESGIHISKEIFIEKLLYKFCLLYHDFINNGFSSVKEDYIKRAFFLGTEVTINVLGEIHSGIAENITDDGSLVLNENNVKNVYFIGDIL